MKHAVKHMRFVDVVGPAGGGVPASSPRRMPGPQVNETSKP